jgi:L-glyceraldehyde 3-phosphate reductase
MAVNKHLFKENRYNKMIYRQCGRSGLKLPAISLGLWHNFGGKDSFSAAREIVLTAFDSGITHFDLANNYGPPAGAAESNFGKILRQDLKSYRDELIISTKAGYWMWQGPYGEWGSRKHLIASLDQSLKRLSLDYVDIFYHHRPDPETPLEETMAALAHIVRQGKSLYLGISNYNTKETVQAANLLNHIGTPCIIHQPCYNMFNRKIEERLLAALEELGIGCIPFSPLAQGLLTDKYLKGIPKDSRAGRGSDFLKPDHITDEKVNMIKKLNTLAKMRGQTLAQMSLAWIMRYKNITSVLMGASKKSQIKDNITVLSNLSFTKEELTIIDNILKNNIK